MLSPGVYVKYYRPRRTTCQPSPEVTVWSGLVSLNASNLGRPTPAEPPKQRVIAYVDGFNLYFGLKAKGWKRYYWLDIKRLAENLTLPSQTIVGVKYFTSRISGPGDKRKRQTTFLEAQEAVNGDIIYYGQFYDQPFTCPICKQRDKVPAEKMTDVNIATEILVDAYRDGFDTLLLVTADSDLVPPLKALRNLFPAKRVVVAFPPERVSTELKKVAHAFINIGKEALSKSLMPDSVQKADGFVLRRPERWG
jgi:uncharacterized LabA/DUF88 family protein